MRTAEGSETARAGTVFAACFGTGMYVYLGLPGASVWIGCLFIGYTIWAALVWLAGPGMVAVTGLWERSLNLLGGKRE